MIVRPCGMAVLTVVVFVIVVQGALSEETLKGKTGFFHWQKDFITYKARVYKRSLTTNFTIPRASIEIFYTKRSKESKFGSPESV